MEKKDIIILVLVVVALAFNLYMRNVRKKKAAAATGAEKIEKKGGISGLPDDYEPYSNK
jgi:ABC-type cobalt transport system substrate-binding protein